MSVDFVRGVRGNLGAHHSLISLIFVVVESACPGDNPKSTDGGASISRQRPNLPSASTRRLSVRSHAVSLMGRLIMMKRLAILHGVRNNLRLTILPQGAPNLSQTPKNLPSVAQRLNNCSQAVTNHLLSQNT